VILFISSIYNDKIFEAIINFVSYTMNAKEEEKSIVPTNKVSLRVRNQVYIQSFQNGNLISIKMPNKTTVKKLINTYCQ